MGTGKNAEQKTSDNRAETQAEVAPFNRVLMPHRLRGLTNDVSEEAASTNSAALARKYGVSDDESAAPVPPPPPRPRPISPIGPHIEMPYDGEEIPWKGNLRADFPEYALEQLNEYCHRHRCTQVSALLQMMTAFTDRNGKPVFYIREEDLVPDRRKVSKKRR